jgi:hypothetical protein
MAGYTRNVDRYGNETNNNSALDFNPVPVDYTPSANGNSANTNSFVIDPEGDMYFIDSEGDSFYINTSNPLAVLSGAQPTPTTSGNTTNLNSVFKDVNGDTWIVDWKGDGVKAASAPVPETITTITDTVATGNKIGTYTNESGVAVDINETLTVLKTFSISGNTISLEYDDEAGDTTTKTVDLPVEIVTTIVNVLSAGNKIATYTNELLDIVDVYETVTSVSDFSIAGSTITLKYIDETGVENTKSFDLPAAVAETVTTITNALTSGNKIGTYTNESAVVVDIYESVTTLANVLATGNKIGDYTNESGVNVVINETITSVSDLSILGNDITLKYIDETGTENTKTVTVPSDVVTTLTNALAAGNKIGTYTNESGAIVDFYETITSIGTVLFDVATGVLTIPYTDEAGVVNDKTVTLPIPLNVLTTVQPTPTATGNTTNLNSTFKDAAGNTWIVDSIGDAIQAGNAPFKNLNEYHVDPNGNDTTGDGSQEKPFLTITKALTVATPNDQVIVHAGSYTEDIVISNPNIALVGAQSEYGSLTQIDGSVTVTASGASVKISDIRIGSIVHTGTSPLYIVNATGLTTLNSSSTGYVEIKNTSIQDGDITKSAGNILIENSKISNVGITGSGTAAVIRDSYQEGASTVTFGAGTIYGIYNLQGGEVVVDAAAIPIESAALAQGLTAEMAKEAETSDFMKLGMLRPDAEASPTKYVTWDEVTGRLEVSPAPSGGGTAPLHEFEEVTATASQTSVTLAKTPVLGTTGKVRVSRNGVDITRAWTWVGAVGTYDPANNYACVIDENDNLQFEYEAL